MTDYISKFTVYIIFGDQTVNIETAAIEDLYFIEDIFSYSIVGKLQFNDRQGLLEFGPLTGNEKIGIVYGVDQDVERVFDIYKINRIIPSWSNANAKENFIEVVFVDDIFYKLTNRKYSKSWKNKKISKIVSDISTDILEMDNFDKWEDSIDNLECFYIPFWTPKKTIDWLIKRGRGSLSRKPGFLFYRNFRGLNFITLESLLQQSRLMEIGWDGSGFYRFEGSSKYPYNKIIGYEMSGLDNMGRMELKGATQKGYNFKKKKLINKKYTYDDGISQFTLLGERSLFTDISDSNVHNVITGESNERIIDNIYYDNWIKTYSMQQILSIVVHGHEQRYTGGLIEVEWPSSHEKEVYNKNYAGKYLVKSITHQFASGIPTYRQKMTLIKNAFEGSDNISLVKSINKNLGSYQYDQE